MATIQGQGRDAEQKPLNTGFAPTTTAAEVISGVGLEGKVAIASRRSERVQRLKRGQAEVRGQRSGLESPMSER
jgi:hypothetical protein